MTIRQRIAIRLNAMANMVAGFPGNVVDNVVCAVKAQPIALARRLRRVALSLCGCHHSTAAGCALYRKDGPDRCECPCHPTDPARPANHIVYKFTAPNNDAVQRAFDDIERHARRGRGGRCTA